MSFYKLLDMNLVRHILLLVQEHDLDRTIISNICGTVISLARALTTPCAKGKVGFHPSYIPENIPAIKNLFFTIVF